ncbi:hypothetical protein [Herbidospora mongoliensis]|uniref:hypothetical protein n=1 Tax=Herbidospora mongoliensis TaxID=688067 RepID=UPI000832D108|nr:hypothetical protein [Herbidospora mongoliensis]
MPEDPQKPRNHLRAVPPHPEDTPSADPPGEAFGSPGRDARRPAYDADDPATGEIPRASGMPFPRRTGEPGVPMIGDPKRIPSWRSAGEPSEEPEPQSAADEPPAASQVPAPDESDPFGAMLRDLDKNAAASQGDAGPSGPQGDGGSGKRPGEDASAARLGDGDSAMRPGDAGSVNRLGDSGLGGRPSDGGRLGESGLGARPNDGDSTKRPGDGGPGESGPTGRPGGGDSGNRPATGEPPTGDTTGIDPATARLREGASELPRRIPKSFGRRREDPPPSSPSDRPGWFDTPTSQPRNPEIPQTPPGQALPPAMFGAPIPGAPPEGRSDFRDFGRPDVPGRGGGPVPHHPSDQKAPGANGISPVGDNAGSGQGFSAFTAHRPPQPPGSSDQPWPTAGPDWPGMPQPPADPSQLPPQPPTPAWSSPEDRPWPSMEPRADAQRPGTEPPADAPWPGAASPPGAGWPGMEPTGDSPWSIMDSPAGGGWPGIEPRADAQRPGAQPPADTPWPGVDSPTRVGRPGAELRADGQRPGLEPPADAPWPGVDSPTRVARPGADPRADAQRPGAQPPADTPWPGVELSAGAQWPGAESPAGAQWPGTEAASDGQWAGADPRADAQTGPQWPSAELRGEVQWPGAESKAGAQWPGTEPQGDVQPARPGAPGARQDSSGLTAPGSAWSTPSDGTAWPPQGQEPRSIPETPGPHGHVPRGSERWRGAADANPPLQGPWPPTPPPTPPTPPAAQAPAGPEGTAVLFQPHVNGSGSGGDAWQGQNNWQQNSGPWQGTTQPGWAQPPGPPRKTKWLWPLIAAVVVLVVAGGTFVYIQTSGGESPQTAPPPKTGASPQASGSAPAVASGGPKGTDIDVCAMLDPVQTERLVPAAKIDMRMSDERTGNSLVSYVRWTCEWSNHNISFGEVNRQRRITINVARYEAVGDTTADKAATIQFDGQKRQWAYTASVSDDERYYSKPQVFSGLGDAAIAQYQWVREDDYRYAFGTGFGRVGNITFEVKYEASQQHKEADVLSNDTKQSITEENAIREIKGLLGQLAQSAGALNAGKPLPFEGKARPTAAPSASPSPVKIALPPNCVAVNATAATLVPNTEGLAQSVTQGKAKVTECQWWNDAMPVEGGKVRWRNLRVGIREFPNSEMARFYLVDERGKSRGTASSKIGGIQWGKIQKLPGLGTDNYGQAIRQQTETAYSGAYEIKVMQDKYVVTVLLGGADRPSGTEINNTDAVLMPLPEAAAGAKEMAAGLLGTL